MNPLPSDTGPTIVVGLGNPGSDYEGTRHNVGFRVVDVLAERIGARFSVHRKSGTGLAQTRLSIGDNSRQVLIAKPRSFMNVSGPPVASLATFFSVTPENIAVVHDDMDLGFGVVRLKRGGGEGGHNGLRSISQALATRDYARIRFGLGRPPGRMDPADFVLKNFTAAERAQLPALVESAADALELLLRVGLATAQNTVHRA